VKASEFCPDITRIKINGSDGVPTPWVVIGPAGFDEGVIKKMDIRSNEVGRVTSIVFDKPKEGPDHVLADCKFDFIQIEHPPNENIFKWNTASEVLKTKMVKRVPSSETPIEPPPDEEEDDDEEEKKGLPNLDEIDTFAADLNFNGTSCLSAQEQTDSINLECDTTLEQRL